MARRMINLLSSSEESFNARKLSRAKATKDEGPGKLIASISRAPVLKEKKAKPIPPPKPFHLKPKPPLKPSFLAGQKLFSEE
ncbi:hypothetical protein GRS66_010432 [Saccharomyces pastorianus]|uniref:Uncharacterized protein n=1 Tax=Saccharomyces pastorianus TaxID=27292 RepID=A0A6C1EEE9_SACPS|nr:hypothetical protein GRS66_010432 [Saccharomyces pastorianus]